LGRNRTLACPPGLTTRAFRVEALGNSWSSGILLRIASLSSMRRTKASKSNSSTASLKISNAQAKPSSQNGGRIAMSDTTETAILAGGCFWPAQELLRHRNGVISTRVGYTGGENDNSTADCHPGHAEVVEVIFDPKQTSYRAILEFFFQIHRPDLGEGLIRSDYRSEVFYTSNGQRQVAEDTVCDLEASGIWPNKVVTKVSEAHTFWAAEAEDQNYLQLYPDGKDQFNP
jgi:peptide-methionine (S)-S-oxide reductase